LASRSSTSVDEIESACSFTSFSPVQATLTPSPSSSPSIDCTSRILGTLPITTSSSVRRQAARIGSAAFLFPAGTISPDNGTPPWMMNFSMGA
jgi:hypothetical protein